MSERYALYMTADDRRNLIAALGDTCARHEQNSDLIYRIRTAPEETSNGWSNPETWTVNLWLSNEQDSSEHARDLCDPAHGRTHYENGELLAEYVEQLIDDWTGETPHMGRDMLTRALARVDWRHLAEHFSER